MKVKKVMAVKGFWKSVIILSTVFIVVYNAIDLLLSFGFDFQKFTQEKLSGTSLVRFLVANCVGGFIYGFIVVFFQFRSKLKKEEQKDGH